MEKDGMEKEWNIMEYNDDMDEFFEVEYINGKRKEEI